jgi:hypothetical protein
MPVFARSFNLKYLAAWDAIHTGNAVRALFKLWALPGENTTAAAPLRLGVRDGYVNFYVKGQSIAKLSSGLEGPKLAVHEAYVEGRARGGERSSLPPAKSYVRFSASALADPATAALIEGWIKTADSYASAEKRFVDDLIAANPGVIDLEMGLPANDAAGSERVAPRMDLVIVEMDGNQPPSIAFWEAKCANNGELRSSEEWHELEGGGFTGPKVINQIEKYVSWMDGENRVAEVRDAYRATATILQDFDRLFRGENAVAPDCVRIWQALAASSKPSVIVEPGIVIGNYWPEGSNEGIASDRMAQNARRFVRAGHREKLERNGLRLHEVEGTIEGRTLPRLSALEVSV